MGRAFDLLAGLVLEDGRTWGAAAYPWQIDDARAVLDPASPHFHYLLRARGCSKTTDTAGILLALLLTEAPPRSRSYCYAADTDQASLLLDAFAGFVDRTPGLAGALDVGADTVTVKATGATLAVQSSDGASSFGLRPFCIVVDEFAAWPRTANHRRLWSAITSSMPKVPGGRLVVITSAGSPNHPAAETWRGALDARHWRTSLRPGPCPWWSPEDIEAVRHELTDAEFRRLILCEWAESDDSLTTPEDIAACVTHGASLEPRRGVRYVMGLDVGLRKDSTVLAITHAEPVDGGGRRVVVDRVLRWTGTRRDPVDLATVEAAIVAMSRHYRRAELVFDVHQAALLTQRLNRQGVHSTEYVFSVAGVNRLARTLHTLLRDRAIALPDDPDLLAELAAVRLVETSAGLVRLDHHNDGHDDQAIAIAMAAARLLEAPGPSRATAHSFAGRSLTARHLPAARTPQEPRRSRRTAWPTNR